MGQNGLPDPNLDEKLDDAFGPAPDLAALLKPRIENDAPADPRGLHNPLAASGGWAPAAMDFPIPDVTINRGGVTWPPPSFVKGAGMIWTLLSRAMNEVLAVGKHGFNEQQRYNFRGIDDVINALGPALRKHGVIPVPKLKKIKYRDTLTTAKQAPTREVTVVVRYRFRAPDGSYEDVLVPGESLDTSDKGSAKAMSVAYRIALIQLFCLPTHEPDPDASHNVRSGFGPMAATVATLVGEKLPTATVYDLLMYWPIIEEHTAADRPMSGAADSPSWLQAFAARYAELIEQVETLDQGRDFAAAMIEGSGLWSHNGTPLKTLTAARGKFIKERQEKTFDHCMEQIVTAQDLAELENAWGCANAALEVKVLDQEQMTQLQTVAQERKLKLAAAPEPSGAPDEPAPNIALHEEPGPAPFLAPEGEQWNRFVTLADAPNLSLEELAELLNGVPDVVFPAATWGHAGLQRVADAAARSHRRDHSIDNTDRVTIQYAITESAQEAGLDAKGYRSWTE